ncbi:hypothetical protein BD779DRAFT_1670658 [Infundibulicybe gibba]|nr:hypothetical protein BD779DRAFT_1670658 [Infundibulicybe gibba]
MPPLDASNMYTPETGSPKPPHIIISPEGSIHVLSYTPTEGERGVPITAQIHLQPISTQSIYVRLVVGHQAVATQVRELQGEPYGRWQLHASAPAFDPRQSASSKLPLRVQLLNEDDAILDSVTFGEFSYWTPGALDESTIPSSSQSHLPTPSPTSPHGAATAGRRTSRINRRSKSTIVRRTHTSKLGARSSESNVEVPILELVTSLPSICRSWSPSEVQAGRRLVRFNKIQDGARLIVSCEPIKQENTASLTVSYLAYTIKVQKRTLSLREKQDRRNLEGLRPTTVSKHRPDFEEFFQRIMEFPDPKPRNIEKDLKVFEWGLLSQALEKILSNIRYTPLGLLNPPAPSRAPSLLRRPPVQGYHPLQNTSIMWMNSLTLNLLRLLAHALAVGVPRAFERERCESWQQLDLTERAGF